MSLTVFESANRAFAVSGLTTNVAGNVVCSSLAEIVSQLASLSLTLFCRPGLSSGLPAFRFLYRDAERASSLIKIPAHSDEIQQHIPLL